MTGCMQSRIDVRSSSSKLSKLDQTLSGHDFYLNYPLVKLHAGD